MINFLEVLVTIVSLILIGVVVAQKSKFGSRARGMDALLSKMTIFFSVIFAILTLVLGRLMHTF